MVEVNSSNKLEMMRAVVQDHLKINCYKIMAIRYFSLDPKKFTKSLRIPTDKVNRKKYASLKESFPWFCCYCCCSKKNYSVYGRRW